MKHQFSSLNDHRFLLVLAFLSLWASITFPLIPTKISTAYAQENECTGDGIYLYEHSNFIGDCKKITSDIPDFRDINFDDVVSSVSFIGTFTPFSYRVILCEHPNYEGTCSPFFIGDDSSLGNNHIKHDRTSSARIEYINFGDSLRIGTYYYNAKSGTDVLNLNRVGMVSWS